MKDIILKWYASSDFLSRNMIIIWPYVMGGIWNQICPLSETDSSQRPSDNYSKWYRLSSIVEGCKAWYSRGHQGKSRKTKRTCGRPSWKGTRETKVTTDAIKLLLRRKRCRICLDIIVYKKQTNEADTAAAVKTSFSRNFQADNVVSGRPAHVPDDNRSKEEKPTHTWNECGRICERS